MEMQKSNIVAVSVSPGFSRADTIAPLLRADRTAPGFSSWGLLLYLFLQPVLHIFTKSTASAIQSIMHVLFLPTPFKRMDVSTESKNPKGPLDNSQTDEILKPGALYSDCCVVQLTLPARVRAERKEGKSKAADSSLIADDGEHGGEELGRIVWEGFEEALKRREKAVGGSSILSEEDKKLQ